MRIPKPASDVAIKREEAQLPAVRTAPISAEKRPGKSIENRRQVLLTGAAHHKEAVAAFMQRRA